MIRVAQNTEIERLREIEVAAGRSFAAIGMAEIARDEPLPAAELLAYQRDGRAAPYYARLGFHEIGDDDLTSGLHEIRAAEAAHGLDRRPRVVMRRFLSRVSENGGSVE